MGHHDDKYNSEVDENSTQVRSIISRINEERPAQEKKREVVVRPDGSKVVRVTKRRRVLVSERDKKRRGRRFFVLCILVGVLLCAAFAGFVSYRMVSMSGEAYMQSRAEELRQAWGAESVRVVGAGVDGSEFYISSLVAEFPEDSMLEKVEVNDLSTSLKMETFITKKLYAETLTAKRIAFYVRPDAKTLKMPEAKGNAPWHFRSIECNDFVFQIGEGDAAPIAIKNSRAYMYYPRNDRSNSVLYIQGGTMQLRGWKTIYLKETKVHLSPVALEEVTLRGSVEEPREGVEQVKSSLEIFGRIANNEPLSGPFYINADNMTLDDFTRGCFENFLSAGTEFVVKKSQVKSRIVLPFEKDEPVFYGGFCLKNITVTSFPAITAMLEHIEPRKRRAYFPPRVLSGQVELTCGEDGSRTITMADGAVQERDTLALRGSITVGSATELSGEMTYGLPGILTRAEYTDGLADPIFQDRGEWAWLQTKISGTANMPNDNMAEIEAQAVEKRKSRPERIQFDQVDIDRLSEQMRGDKPGHALDANPFDEPKKEDESPFGEDPSSNSDNPFAPLSPF